MAVQLLEFAMKVKKSKAGRIAVSVRFSPAMYARLKALAERTQRSVSWHVARTMDEAMDYIEREVAAIEVGMKDVREGRTRPAEEVIAEMRAIIEKHKAGNARRAG